MKAKRGIIAVTLIVVLCLAIGTASVFANTNTETQQSAPQGT